jgi:hypothetical protein
MKLEAGPDYSSENLIRCYEEMARLAAVGAEEITVVQAWVEDLAGVS